MSRSDFTIPLPNSDSVNDRNYTAQWLNILGEGTNNSYTINELSCCNFLVLDVIFWD